MPVQLRMVQPKHRLRRRNIHIAPGVPPDAEMPSNMQRGECIRPALQVPLERANRRGARNVREQIARPKVVFGEEIADVAAQTARVVCVAVCAGVRGDAETGVDGGG